MSSEKKRKPGRPGRPRTVGERVPLGLRVSTELKARLDSAAKESGRSQSQEAELRLEQSLKSEDALYAALDLVYGRELTAIILTMARAVHLAGTRAAFVDKFTDEAVDNWMANPYAFDQAAWAANAILEAFRPPGETGAPKNIAPDFAGAAGLLDVLGEGFAANVLEAVTTSSEVGEPAEWAKPIIERLAKSDVHIRFEQEGTSGGSIKERKT